MPNLHGLWDERRQLFNRALAAEDEGRLSRAVELYEALGRKEDVQRLREDKKEEIQMNPDHTLTIERVKHYLSITEKAK